MNSNLPSNRLSSVVISVLLAVFIIVGGCGKKDAGKVIHQDEDVTVQQQGDTVSITSKEGTVQYTSGENVDMPKDFPDDVPTYPGMQVEFAGKAGEMFTVNGRTGDELAAVSDSLKREAEKNGWSQTMSINQSGGDGKPGMMMTYAKENRMLNLVIATADQGTSISIMTGSQ